MLRQWHGTRKALAPLCECATGTVQSQVALAEEHARERERVLHSGPRTTEDRHPANKAPIWLCGERQEKIELDLGELPGLRRTRRPSPVARDPLGECTQLYRTYSSWSWLWPGCAADARCRKSPYIYSADTHVEMQMASVPQLAAVLNPARVPGKGMRRGLRHHSPQ